MSYYRYSLLLAISLSMTGCAVTSGLQTSDIPSEGVYETDLGTPVNVIKLTQDTIFAVQPAQENIQQNFSHLFKASQPQYLLSPGDILSIYLWAYPEITPPTNNINNEEAIKTNGFQIDQTGYIHFPIIGRYKAAGKPLVQVNKELRQQLARYLKTPDVIARVLSYQGQRYSVQGNVMKGGQYYLNDQPTSIYTALGLAGGVNAQQGTSTSVSLVRDGKTYQLNTIELEKAGLSLHNLLVRPNDTIYVNSKENHKIYVMGETGKNDALPMRDQGMTLSDVLGESYGLNPLSASRSKVYIVRSVQDTPITEVFHMDLTSIADFGLANQFKMQSNDIVYVDASGLARWQRVVNQLVPFSSVVYQLDNLGR